MPGKFNTVLFDLDGTLVDSRTDLVSAINHSLVAAGLKKKPAEEIIPHVGNGLRVLLSGVFGSVPESTLEKGIAAFQTYYDEHCVDATVLYDDALPALAHLSQKSRLGIVTNKPKRYAEKILKTLAVADKISSLAGGDSFPEKKPHPRPVLEVMKELGGSVETTLMVGDGHQDIQAGQAAGIKTCVARYGYGFLPDTLALKPDYVINALSELKEIVG